VPLVLLVVLLVLLLVRLSPARRGHHRRFRSYLEIHRQFTRRMVYHLLTGRYSSRPVVLAEVRIPAPCRVRNLHHHCF
jgi:hypothetical protein